MDRNLGTLLDNCSTDNYITNAMAEKYQLPGEDVELIVEGIGGETNKVNSKIFQVPIKDKFGQEHVIECYGMDVIATPTKLPEKDSYFELCKRFKVSPQVVRRPKTIDLLISMRDNHLHADKKLKTIGKMSLYEGLLGKVFGGLDPKLKFRQKFKIPFRSTREIVPQVSVKTLRAALKEVNNPAISQTHTAGLRVAEIQQKSDVDSWRNLPSSENISDILTRGAKTDMIARGSVWQCGPAWLIKDETEWPVSKTESKLSETEKDNVQIYLKSQKEACILNIEAITYSSNIKTENSPSNIGMEGPRCQVLKLFHGVAAGFQPIVVRSSEEMEDLIKRCSNLEKLVRSRAYVLRLMGRRPLVSGVREVVDKTVSTDEYDDARRFLINLEQ